MENQSGAIKTNLELYRVVKGGSGGYRRLPGGSAHFSLQTNRQTDRHFIIIYISSPLLLSLYRHRVANKRTDWFAKSHLSPRSCHPGLGLASKSDWEYLNNEPIGKIGKGALNLTFYLRIHVLIKIYGPIERNQNCWVNLKKVAKWLRLAKLGLNAAASCGSVAGPATHTLKI